MSRVLRFKLDIEPQSLQFGASRQAIRTNRQTGKQFIAHFSDDRAKAFRDSVAMLVAPHRPRAPFEGALRVEFHFVQPRPAYLCKKGIPPVRLLCPVRPDYTNLAKGFEDVLTKARFWHDDGQLSDARSIKYYAAVGERPCIEVEIEAFTAWDSESQQSPLPL